jgi:hypothetical protein
VTVVSILIKSGFVWRRLWPNAHPSSAFHDPATIPLREQPFIILGMNQKLITSRDFQSRFCNGVYSPVPDGRTAEGRLITFLRLPRWPRRIIIIDFLSFCALCPLSGRRARKTPNACRTHGIGNVPLRRASHAAYPPEEQGPEPSARRLPAKEGRGRIENEIRRMWVCAVTERFFSLLFHSVLSFGGNWKKGAAQIKKI